MSQGDDLSFEEIIKRLRQPHGPSNPDAIAAAEAIEELLRRPLIPGAADGSYLTHLESEVKRLQEEITGLQYTFDLMWKADMRAIKLWQEATGKMMDWPDRAKLTQWLLERLDEATTKRDRVMSQEHAGIVEELQAQVARLKAALVGIRNTTDDVAVYDIAVTTLGSQP